MLRHVVMWKMAGDTPEERSRVAAELRDRLLGLVPVIDVIRAFEVGINNVNPDDFDLVLVSEFDDADALAHYVQHPQHQEVIAFVHANTVGRCAVDYTF